MPILAGIVISLFGSLSGFFADMLGKKVAVAAAYVATLATVMAGMLALLAAVVVPIANAVFSSYPWIGWMALAFPPAASICITALATVWAGTVLFAWQREALRIASAV